MLISELLQKEQIEKFRQGCICPMKKTGLIVNVYLTLFDAIMFFSIKNKIKNEVS